MDDLSFAEILRMQRALQHAHADDWEQPAPENARNFLLWMVEEVGEMAAIIKKKGDASIMEDHTVRGAFLEEMADVLMYFGDLCLAYGIDAADLARAFAQKHARNLKRDFHAQHAGFLASSSNDDA